MQTYKLEIKVSCHVIIRNRLSLSMGSRGVAAGANPSLVSGRGQGAPWTSRQLIAGQLEIKAYTLFTDVKIPSEIHTFLTAILICADSCEVYSVSVHCSKIISKSLFYDEFNNQDSIMYV